MASGSAVGESAQAGVLLASAPSPSTPTFDRAYRIRDEEGDP
jgi:hypothetical protein